MASSAWETLTFKREERLEGVILYPIGEIDLGTAPALWSHLKAILEDGLSMIVAMSGVTYIDSTGLKALLDSHHLFLERGQRLALAEPPHVLRRVMEIAGLERAIPIYSSLEAALQSFHAPTHASSH